MSIRREKGSRVAFERVHSNVDTLMEIFHRAAKAAPARNDELHLLYKLATIEYLKRVGWRFDEFSDACEKLSSGQTIKNDAPVLESAIS